MVSYEKCILIFNLKCEESKSSADHIFFSEGLEKYTHDSNLSWNYKIQSIGYQTSYNEVCNIFPWFYRSFLYCCVFFIIQIGF